MLRARFAVLLSSVVLAATLVPVAPAVADETPTPAPTPVIEAVTPDPTPEVEPVQTPEPPATEPPAAKPPATQTPPTAPAAYAGAGSVVIDHTTTPFVAQPTSSWPAGTKFTYRWYRGASATTATVAATGTGASTATYTPNTSDRFLRVAVTATVPGFTGTVTRYSDAADYSLTVLDGAAAIFPFPLAIGDSADVEWTELTHFSAAGSTVNAPTPSGFQWLRNGSAISGATASTYKVVAADVGKNLSVRFTATSPGAAPTVITTSGWLVHSLEFTGASVSIAGPSSSAPTGVLTATPSWSDPRPAPAAVPTFQWYRNDVAISGQKSATYRLTSADAHAAITVKVTLAKPGYATLVVENGDLYTLEPTGVVAIGALGDQHVGGTVTAVKPTYHLGGFYPDPSTITFGYQWLRDGAAISGATGSGYTLVAADGGHKLSVRVSAAYGGYLPSVHTSASTQKLGSFVFTDSGIDIEVLHTGIPATMAVGATGVTGGGGTVIAYQWLRDGAAISGATASTYKLTPADFGTETSVRLAYTAPGYTTYVKTSDRLDYSLWPSAAPGVSSMTGSYRVGDTLGLVMPDSFDINGNTVTPTATFQWLRNGAAIAGATAGFYRLQPADKGAKISIRVTAGFAGHNSWIGTSAPTATIDTGTLIVDDVTPNVSNDDGLLTATLPSGSVHTEDVSYSYQWYRQTGSAAPVAVSGQTRATYLLTSADFDKKVSVRVTVSKKNVVPSSVPLTSIGKDYTIKVASPAIVSGTNRVGGSLVFLDGDYADAANNDVFPSFDAVQWYRNGVAIAGATSTSYTPVAADLNTTLTARVTERLSGFVSRTITAAAPGKTALGVLLTSGEFLPEVIPGTLAAQVRASVPAGNVLTPGVTYTYQWRRNGAAVKGATTSTFTLLSTDATKTISVVVTTHKAGYANLVSETVPRTWALKSTHLMAIYSSPAPTGLVGVPLTIGEQPGWQYAFDSATVAPATLKYQWYRNGVAIAGATSAGYTLTAADYNAMMTVRQYVSGPGIIPTSALSGQAGPIGLGQNLPGYDGTAVATMNAATNTLTASIQAGSLIPATPAPVLTYQWYRQSGSDPAVKIAGATKSTYTLNNGADYQKLVFVEIRVQRDKFSPLNQDDDYRLTSTKRNYTSLPGPQVQFVATPVFGIPLVAPTQTWVDANGTQITSALTPYYQWYRTSDPTGFAGDVQLIAGATKATYTPGLADLGKYLFVQYSAIIPGYLTPPHPSSKPSNQVQKGSLLWNGNLPIIAGTSTPSLKLTVIPPTSAFGVAPTSWSYQWIRRVRGTTSPVTDIAGATSSTYTLAASDEAFEVNVRVTANRPGYASQQMLGVAWIDRGIVATGTPSISPNTGIHTDSVLTAQVPGYTPNLPGVTVKYQWYRWVSGVAHVKVGTNSPTYTVVAADVGHQLWVEVTYVKAGYLGASPGSAFTQIVAPATFSIGSGLTVTRTIANPNTMQLKTTANVTGKFSPSPTSFSYEWYRNGTAIPGATSSLYTLTQSDLGQSITSAVVAHRAGYTDAKVLADSAVGTNYSLQMARAELNGTAAVDTLLTVAPGALTPSGVSGVTYTYSWFRENQSTGATTKLAGTSASYKIVPADVGQFIYAKVHAVKPGYLTETGVKTWYVIPVNATIQGSKQQPNIAYVGSTRKFTASIVAGTVTTPGVAYSYQWYRDSAPISGATASSYVRPSSQGGVYWVVVTVKKSGYNPVTLPESAHIGIV